MVKGRAHVKLYVCLLLAGFSKYTLAQQDSKAVTVELRANWPKTPLLLEAR